MKKPETKEERLYREALGDDALERVKTAFAERHACCWERIEDGHHPVCSNYSEDDGPPPLIEGQESFA